MDNIDSALQDQQRKDYRRYLKALYNNKTYQRDLKNALVTGSTTDPNVAIFKEGQYSILKRIKQLTQTEEV